MPRKINNDFQWLLHIAFLRKVIKEHPENYKSYIEAAAKEIATRLVDDFCAKYLIYEKIDKSEAIKYLKTFLAHYFDNDILVENNEIKIINEILKHQKSPGILLIKNILQSVFDTIGSGLVFDELNGRLIFKTENYISDF
jgi:hypothetical protein